MGKHYDKEIRAKAYPERRLVIMVMAGRLEPEEVIDGIADMIDLDGYDPGYNGVVDMRRARVKGGLEGTKKIADFVIHDRISTDGKWSYLVTEPVATAMTYYYSQLIEVKHQGRTHFTVEAASDFIGIELADILEESV